MGKLSSSVKNMNEFNFFILILIVSIVITMALAFIYSEADIVPIGLLFSVLISFFLTLFRILKKSDAPNKRLGNWKYFFALSIFIMGLFVTGIIIFGRSDLILVALITGLIVSSIISMKRGIKHWRQEKNTEKVRNQQKQEQLKQQNAQYAKELEKKDRIISELRSRNSELQNDQRTLNTTSSSPASRYQNQYYEEQIEKHREQKRREEEEERKKERLENWYNDYVTIEVNFDYHIIDREYNSDYWDCRSEDIRVTRREAMALIQAGESAIMGRLGYSSRGNIRNISYKVPFRLYDPPFPL